MLQDDGSYHGDVINTSAVITFASRLPPALQKAIKDSVEDYIAFCRSRGGEPPSLAADAKHSTLYFRTLPTSTGRRELVRIKWVLAYDHGDETVIEKYRFAASTCLPALEVAAAERLLLG